MRPVIHSDKHYVQMSRSTVTTVTAVTETLITAVEGTTANLVDEVVEGAVVKAIYIELWLLNSSNDGSDIVVVAKVPLGLTGPSFTESNSLGTWKNKKNIFFTHQGLSSNNGVGNPIQILGGWLKIPKSKQRFGLGDQIQLTIANNGPSTLEYCGFATYKEYT